MPKILQLCFVSNLWPAEFKVTSFDIKTGQDILTLPDNIGIGYDYVFASPPCDQFTKANSQNWQPNPFHFIELASKCFLICIKSKTKWLFENPPGRIESFLPILSRFRICTWHGLVTNKEYCVYSNFLLLNPYVLRYGKLGSVSDYSKSKRELWQPDFADYVLFNLNLSS